jgi:ketosteroid isomerase-like protein
MTMKMKLLRLSGIFPAALLMLQISGCTNDPDQIKEVAAISKVLDNNTVWFKDKDFDLLFSTYTHGPDLFMYQPDSGSTISGFDEFVKYSEGWKNPDLKYSGHKFYDLRVTISEAGDVAWFSCKIEDCWQRKDNPPKCLTSRYTGVLEKRDGKWLIVQQHFSLAADEIAPDWAARTVHDPADL